jgi:anti-anti-sigma factor
MDVFRLTERDIWPGCREIKVEGELDLVVSGQLRSAFDRAAVEGLNVLVDFAACDFIDVSGVTALVHGDERLVACGRQLLLRGVHGQVRRTLWVTGLAGANHGGAAPLRQPLRHDQALATNGGVGLAA